MTTPAEADTPAITAPSPGPTRRRSRRQQHYFVLALFNVLTVCLALYVTHRLMAIHIESVAVNAQWVARGNQYARLGELAAAVNAPGNDIFESRDVARESRRLDDASRAFETHLATLLTDLRRHVPETMRPPLAQRIDDIALAMADMTRKSKLIFESVRRNDLVAAGQRMASMDRTYHRVNTGIARLRLAKNAVQSHLFAQQLTAARRLNVIENVLAAMTLLMIAAALWYGRRITRQADAQAGERERRIAELTTTQVALAAARDELEHRVQQRTIELDSFFDLSLDMLCIASFDGYFVRLNPAWEEVLGYTPAELMAEPLIEFVHPDDREVTNAKSEGLARGEPTLAFENRYRCKDGTYKWLVWKAAPTSDRTFIYAAAHDITERRAAEAQLQAQATSLAEAQKIGRLGNWEWDVGSDVVRWSDQMYRVVGLHPTDFTPAVDSVIQLVHPDDRDVAQPDQRHPRFLQDRSRQDDAGADSLRPPACVRSRGRHDGDARGGQGPRPHPAVCAGSATA